MVWKKVSNSDAGTIDKFGGNDTDKISDALSGVDVDDIAMNCDFDFNKAHDMTRTTLAANPAADKARKGFIQVDANNDSCYTIEKVGGSFQAVYDF